MTNQLPTDPHQPQTNRLRNLMPALLATLIVVGTIGLMLAGIAYLSNKDEFDRIKELLLFINPLLGVAVGYYFNKSSTEGRAESAEATARTANLVAQQAQQSQSAAQTDAAKATELAQAATQSLNEMAPLVDQIMQAPTPQPGTLGLGDPAPAAISEDTRRDLQAALARARRIPGVH